MYAPFVPERLEDINDNTPTMLREGYEYYRTSRGQHPNAKGRFLMTSLDKMLAFSTYDLIPVLLTQPLGLKGALINGRPGDSFLDDPRYAPVLAAFDELNVPLYVHPGLPLPAVQAPYYGGFDRELGARLAMFAWGWHNEAGIQVVRMLLAGVFDRYPRLQIISGHWGEMVPFFLQRLEDSIPQEASGLARPIVQTYREHVYVSPSGMLTLPHFQFIFALMGAERILYSIDYPYQSLDGARAFIERLPVSDADKALIAQGNAERLLGL